ncbi:MAG: YdiU family protein [Desulfocapsaceae bacterium]|nr:YdiU family protein [Desulfocapsaceae bacterium]
MKTPPEKQLLVPLPLRFDNKFVRELPGDQQADNYRRQVTGACYSRVQPTEVADPKLVAYSREAAALLDLSPEACATPSFTEVFAGNRLLPGMKPFAMCYGGHQFGNWAGQLGDGRAINLGEVINDQGERWIVQLKGAGPTPYSRGADGMAVLRSSIREFLCSEAMHHLGIPTSRALSVISSGESVERDMFYDGRPKDEPGAIVCRLAPSFLRFGNYEILSLRGETTLLKQLVDYTIRTDFPHLGEPSTAVYLDWFREICRSTAAMIVHWMRVGFVHGVMNTDNMSILGLTIDYGPYGWLEGFDANWTPNTTDSQGRRYSFGNQPHIGQWNLLQLANAIYPLVNQAEPFEEALAMYNELFFQEWNKMMAAKLGFTEFIAKTDESIITELLNILQLVETDMTIFFRQLASIPTSGDHTGQPATLLPFRDAWYQPETITEDYRRRIDNWLDTYITRLHQDNLPDEERRTRMNRVNPKYVLRNYMAQLAIDKAEKGDFSMVDELLDLVRRPYDEQPDREHFFRKRPEWARNRAGCSMLSCSS